MWRVEAAGPIGHLHEKSSRAASANNLKAEESIEWRATTSRKTRITPPRPLSNCAISYQSRLAVKPTHAQRRSTFASAPPPNRLKARLAGSFVGRNYNVSHAQTHTCVVQRLALLAFRVAQLEAMEAVLGLGFMGSRFKSTVWDRNMWRSARGRTYQTVRRCRRDFGESDRERARLGKRTRYPTICGGRMA